MKNILKTISKKEKKFIWIIIILVVLITTIPYLYGFFTTPQGYTYNGLHSLTHGDYPVYYSYINQIKNGQIFLTNNFSIENQNHKIFNVFWLFAGLIAKILDIGPALTIQILRILSIPFALWVLYIFISYVFSEKLQRKLSFIFLLFSGGVGAFAIPFIVNNRMLVQKQMHWPIDFWVSESNTFLTLYHLPHIILSLSLMVLIFLLLKIAADENNYKYSFYAGLIGLILFNFHPYYFVSINAIFGIYLIYLLIKKLQKIKNLLTIFLLWFIPSVISVIYHYYLIENDPIIGARAAQNITLTPPILYVAIGYGFLIIFAFTGIYYYLKQKKLNTKIAFLIIWVGVSLIILYLPINFQRRFLQGVQIPLTLLTIYSFQFIKNKYFIKIKNNKYLAITLFIILFALSPFTNLVRDIVLFKDNLPNFYLQNTLLDSINWLEQNNGKSTPILTYENQELLSPGFWIIGYINQKVYLSHEHETVFFEQKKSILQNLQIKNNPQKWNDFYQKYNIKYILLTQSHKNQNNFNQPNLHTEYENQDYIIYSTNINQTAQ